jgi:hypothetical protein
LLSYYGQLIEGAASAGEKIPSLKFYYLLLSSSITFWDISLLGVGSASAPVSDTSWKVIFNFYVK